MNEAPLNYIKEIQSALIEATDIPLSGYAPAFPWEDVSMKIASLFHLPELSVLPRKTQFLTAGEITSGLGAGFVTIALDMTPLNGQAFWLMGREDVAKLTALTLTTSNGNKGFASPKFQEGFYTFLGTQIVHAIDALHPFHDLSLKIGKASPLPQQESLCTDIEIHHPKHTLWGRLVCPASFHQAFKTHFSTQEPEPLTSEQTRHIDVTLQLEIGRTQLTLAHWQAVSVGDFILLDRCTFDPTTLKGTVTLMLHQTPLLRARIKDNSLKIVDYAFYREEQSPMNPQMPDEHPEEMFDKEEIPPAEFEEEGQSDENHLWNRENDQNHSIEKMISTKEIPLLLTVEVARLHITLDKLLQLSPGNVLELPVKPEQGVDITVGGKKVAKAELVRLGEMLGVKILQMGE